MNEQKKRVGELPGIHGKHGAKYLLDAHGEVVGNGHRRTPHYLDNQGRQRRSLNNRRALQTRFELCNPQKANCARPCSSNFHIHTCVGDLYIFPGSVHLGLTNPWYKLWIRITSMRIRMRFRIRLITLMRIRILIFIWCGPGCGSGFDFSPWCGSGSRS